MGVARTRRCGVENEKLRGSRNTAYNLTDTRAGPDLVSMGLIGGNEGAANEECKEKWRNNNVVENVSVRLYISSLLLRMGGRGVREMRLESLGERERDGGVRVEGGKNMSKLKKSVVCATADLRGNLYR